MTEFILETRAWVLFDTWRGEDSRLRMASGAKWDKVVPQDFKKKGRRQAPITTVEVERYWEDVPGVPHSHQWALVMRNGLREPGLMAQSLLTDVPMAGPGEPVEKVRMD